MYTVEKILGDFRSGGCPTSCHTIQCPGWSLCCTAGKGLGDRFCKTCLLKWSCSVWGTWNNSYVKKTSIFVYSIVWVNNVVVCVCMCVCVHACVCALAWAHACVCVHLFAACGTNFLCLNYSGSKRRRWILSRLPWGPRVRQGCHPRMSWCWAGYDPLRWARACRQHTPCPRQCSRRSSSRRHHTSWAACPLCRPPSSQVGWFECFPVAAAAVCLVVK